MLEGPLAWIIETISNGINVKGLTLSLKIQDPLRLGEIIEIVDQKVEAFRAAFFP